MIGSMKNKEYEELLLKYLSKETNRNEEKRLLDYFFRGFGRLSRLVREYKKELEEK